MAVRRHNLSGNRLIRLAAFLLTLNFSTALSAQTKELERHYTVKTDASTNVGIFASIRKNCTAGPLPAIRLVSQPQHGKLTVKKGRLSAQNLGHCLSADVPALIALYRPHVGFLGRDSFTIEVTGADSKSQMQKITVDVFAAGSQHSI